MRLLADTHILLALAEQKPIPQELMDVMNDFESDLYASVASLWEIAIKVRLGKLPLKLPLDAFPAFLTKSRFMLVGIRASHALALADPEPQTRDPFDRMLLTQCQVEGFKFITVDRALVGHPLAWRAS